MKYNVIINGHLDSSHDSYVEARDQAGLIRGRVEDINEQGDAFNTGYEAAQLGDPKKDCPYPRGSWERLNWLAGWEAGQ